MIQPQAFLTEINEFVRNRFGYKGAALTMTSAWRELGVDSLGMVELVAELETKYRLTIPNDQIEKMRTLGDTYQLLQR